MRKNSDRRNETVNSADSDMNKNLSGIDKPEVSIAAKGRELAGRGDLPALEEIMRILLSPQGCPWDRKQTHESLMKYMREETEEAAQAVASKDWDNLKEELGDCLLQIVFHAEMARLEGHFCLADVIKGINAKMVRRHPHIFGEKKSRQPRRSAENLGRSKKTGKRKEKLKKFIPFAILFMPRWAMELFYSASMSDTQENK